MELALATLGELLASADTRLPDGGVSDELRLIFVLPETPLLGGRGERARLAFQAMRTEGANGIPLTASFGIAAYPVDGSTDLDLLAAAEPRRSRKLGRKSVAAPPFPARYSQRLGPCRRRTAAQHADPTAMVDDTGAGTA